MCCNVSFVMADLMSAEKSPEYYQHLPNLKYVQTAAELLEDDHRSK